MEIFEKEEAYQRAFASGRVCNNLRKYIPKRLKVAVVDCMTDSDGYWIFLDDENGWTAYDHGSDCGTIHEYTIADVKNAIQTISKR